MNSLTTRSREQKWSCSAELPSVAVLQRLFTIKVEHRAENTWVIPVAEFEHIAPNMEVSMDDTLRSVPWPLMDIQLLRFIRGVRALLAMFTLCGTRGLQFYRERTVWIGWVAQLGYLASITRSS
jgi:hypothetical protein